MLEGATSACLSPVASCRRMKAGRSSWGRSWKKNQKSRASFSSDIWRQSALAGRPRRREIQTRVQNTTPGHPWHRGAPVPFLRPPVPVPVSSRPSTDQTGQRPLRGTVRPTTSRRDHSYGYAGLASFVILLFIFLPPVIHAL